MNYLKTFLPYLFGNKKGKSLEISVPSPIPWNSLNFEETLMFHALGNSLNRYVQSLDLSTLPDKDIFQLLNFLSYLNHDLQDLIQSTFKAEYVLFLEALKAKALDAHELQELLDFKTEELTVFALLKKDRGTPGVLVVRAASGRFVMNDQGGIWSIPVLGLSSRGLPFHHSNGCSPAGVFSLDSVMPEANNPYEFGQFKRLIVNFIPKSPGETEIKKYLPAEHHSGAWWKASIVGRELGRSLLRIHGTGRVNRNPFTSYYPFVPTSGCLATNEGRFFGLPKAQDQRLLLDVLMLASNLPPTVENESKIHGLLYVVELGDNLSALRFLS